MRGPRIGDDVGIDISGPKIGVPSIDIHGPKIGGGIDINAPNIDLNSNTIDVPGVDIKMNDGKLRGKMDLRKPKIGFKKTKNRRWIRYSWT